MKIGFFDSGIGGLTVLREALRVLPCEEYIYYADTDNVPYGPKSKEEVRAFVLNAAEFMARQGIKALVVACNTATSIAIDDLRKLYSFPVIGMEPAVKPAVEANKNKRVLVTATELTLKEEKFHNLVARVDSAHIVDMLPLPGLVEFAEKFVFDEQTVAPYLKRMLSPYDMNLYGTIVLGCTHFPFYKRLFMKAVPCGVSIIDGNTGTVRRLKSVLEESTAYPVNAGGGRVEFFSSGRRASDATDFTRYFTVLDGLNRDERH